MTGPGLYVLTFSGQNTLFPLGLKPCSRILIPLPKTLAVLDCEAGRPCTTFSPFFGRFSHCTSGWAGTHCVAVMANLHCQFVSLQFWKCLWCFQRLTEERRACLNVMTPTYHSGGPGWTQGRKRRKPGEGQHPHTLLLMHGDVSPVTCSSCHELHHAFLPGWDIPS